MPFNLNKTASAKPGAIQLSPDQINIGQSFVRDMTSDSNDAGMLQTIIDMDQNFRLNVIAQRIETEARLSLLKNFCRMAYQFFRQAGTY